MNTTQLIVTALLTYGPDFARAIRNILSVDNPTTEQWEALFAKAEKTYAQLVPASRIPAGE